MGFATAAVLLVAIGAGAAGVARRMGWLTGGRTQTTSLAVLPFEMVFAGRMPPGLRAEEIRAIVHVVGIYCGVPQALECFRVARKVLEEQGLL